MVIWHEVVIKVYSILFECKDDRGSYGKINFLFSFSDIKGEVKIYCGNNDCIFFKWEYFSFEVQKSKIFRLKFSDPLVYC